MIETPLHLLGSKENWNFFKWNVVNEGKLVDNVNCDMWYINYTTSRHHVRWLKVYDKTCCY